MRPWLDWMRRKTLAKGSVLALALVALWTCPSLAVRRPESPQLFKLRGMDGWLGVGMEIDEEARKRPDRKDVEDTKRELFEELKLDIKSSVYHPRFLLVDGSVLVRLEQEERETTPESIAKGDLDELVNEYDLTLSFLSERPYNLLLFGSRSTSSFDSLDFPEYEVTTERMGALGRWRNKRFPMWLSVSSDEIRGGGTNLTDEVTRNLTYNVEQKKGRRLSSFLYEWNERENRRSDTEVTSHRALLRNHISFGPKGRSDLSSNLQLQNREGAIERQEALGSANLLLHHWDTFQTNYSYQGHWSKVESEENLSNGGGAGFVHRLYRNLTTSGNVGGVIANSDTGQTFEGETSLAFDYVRSIPYGSISAGTRVGIHYREEEFTTDVGRVLDETHTFTVSDVVRLRNEFVQTSTIVVTDTGGLTIFIENIDYQVRVIGSLTEIIRLIGGTIPAGDTVLVDYQFDRSLDQRYTTFDEQFRFALNLFQSLRLYTSMRSSDRHLIEGIERGGEGDISDWISGISFSRWQIRLDAQHQEHDSEIVPYTSNRVSAGIGLRLPLRSSLSASAGWSRTDFPNLESSSDTFIHEDFSESINLQGRLAVHPIRNLSIEGGGFFREEQGRVDLKETVFFGEMRLRIRKVEIIVRGERREEEQLSDSGLETLFNRERNLIHAEIIRRF